MSEFEIVTISEEFVTISSLVWQRHKMPMVGMVEAIIESNRGITASGVHLPLGMRIKMPIVEQDEQPQESTAVTLWS